MNALATLNTLEKLEISRWHWKLYLVIGLSLQFNGILNSSGNSVLADLVDRGWSNNYLNAAFSSSMMAGFFIGSLVAGSLGDRLGRKRTYQLCILMFGVMALVGAAAPSMAVLIICRGLMGIGMGGGIVIGYGSFTEFVPGPVRGTWSARLSLLGNLSPAIAAGLAALLIPALGWRSMFILGGVLALLILVVVSRELTESPRWLIAQGREAEAAEIVASVAGRDEAALPVPETAEEKEILEVVTSQDGRRDRTPFWDFFRGDLGRRTLVATATLVAMNLSLYTITQWIPTIFVNQGIDIKKSLTMTMVMMLGAPVGVFISTLIMDRLPRRVIGTTLILVVAALGYLYSRQATETSILVVGTLMIIVLYIYNSFSSAVYAPEVWPTAQKMRGLGISNSIGRVVAIASPYLVAWLLTEFGVTAVFVVLGLLLASCALILAVFGIETRGRSVEELTVNVEPAGARIRTP